MSSRDFAGRPIIKNLKIEVQKSETLKLKVQSESDFDNYDRAIDENPMHIIGYNPEWDMSFREKEVRRIR